MSTTGDGDLAPGGQEGPAGAAGAQAGARDGVDHNSEPRRGDSMPDVEAGGDVGASGGPREAALEGGNSEEDSDIETAEEGEEEVQAQGVNLMVDSQHFSMTRSRLTVLSQRYPILNRMYKNHILVPPEDDHGSVRHQTRPRLSNLGSATVARFSEVQVHSDGPGEGPVGGPAQEALAQEAEQAEEAQEAAEEAEEASLWETATKESEEHSLSEMPQEPATPESEHSRGGGELGGTETLAAAGRVWGPGIPRRGQAQTAGRAGYLRRGGRESGPP